MKLKEYIHRNNLNNAYFTKRTGLCRFTLNKYFAKPSCTPLYVRLAIELLTDGDVSKGDWNDN